MESNNTHPAIHRLRCAYTPTVSRIHHHLDSGYTPPPPPVSTWKPKNPEMTWLDMNNERNLSQAEWKASNFPIHPLPTSVTGMVNVQAWDNKITELMNSDEINQGLVNIMKEISLQLSQGASSHVGSPGTALKQCSNMLHEAPKQIPCVVGGFHSVHQGRP